MYITNQYPQPEAPYEYQEYPKYVDGIIVQNAEEEAALLGADTSGDRDALLAAAAAKGVKIDKRWSDDKLRAAIEAA